MLFLILLVEQILPCHASCILHTVTVSESFVNIPWHSIFIASTHADTEQVEEATKKGFGVNTLLFLPCFFSYYSPDSPLPNHSPKRNKIRKNAAAPEKCDEMKEMATLVQ